MDIAIRGRNVELPDSLKATVADKLSRLARFLDGMERAEVRFSEERNPRIPEKEVCEVTMHGHGHVVRARAAGVDVLTAVDRVVDKLEHRMEKLRGKLQGRTHPRRHGSVDSPPVGSNTRRTSPNASDGSDGADEGASTIVKTKQFAIQPMTPDDAVLRMDLLGHDFFFFTNAETHRAAVVYRRLDGDVGLIDAE